MPLGSLAKTILATDARPVYRVYIDGFFMDKTDVTNGALERMHMSLKNKVAIVTGGNSGIGKAIVLELASQGANIVIDYIAHPDATDELEKQIAAMVDCAMGVDADVSKIGDLQKLVDAAVSRFGRVDIMVNNAGVETRT